MKKREANPIDLLPFSMGLRLLFKCLDDDSWIATDNRIRRHVFDDNGTRSDNGIVADRDARIDDGTPANPYIIADAHRLAAFDTGEPLLDIERMSRCIDVDARAHQAIVANANVADVEEHAIEIGEEIVADVDIIAVVAAEVRLDIQMIPARAE